MAESLSIRLQPQSVDIIERIAEKRRENDGIKDSKSRIVAEAVKKLADQELKG